MDALYTDCCQMLFDQFPVALITDAQGRYLYVNKGWQHYMGYKPEDVIGKKVSSIVPETRVEDVLRTGEPVTGYRITGKDGSALFNHCIPLKKDGIVIGSAVLTFFHTIEDAIDFSDTVMKLTRQLHYYQKELKKLRGAKHTIDELVGSSPAMGHLKQQIRDAARTMSTVLIQGETGCGKELVANAIHDLSPRSENPFIKINCSAIPPDLVESELFGYEAGSFTGAKKGGKTGLFESADTGSLFLDEINQMAYYVQPKLLRVLQEKEVLPVGSHTARPIDTRIIAATNQPLEKLVEQNLFREDLFYRLNVVKIYIPPLREHPEDIPELLETLRVRLNRELGTCVSGLTAAAEERLMQYHWPGNVRELQNVLERAINVQMNGVLDWNCFQDYFEMKKAQTSASSLTLAAAKDSAEKSLIQNCLMKNKYNKTKTAAELGISRTLLYQKISKYHL